MNFIKNGGSLINRIIAQKISESCNEIRLKGNYEIEVTILLAKSRFIKKFISPFFEAFV